MACERIAHCAVSAAAFLMLLTPSAYAGGPVGGREPEVIQVGVRDAAVKAIVKWIRAITAKGWEVAKGLSKGRGAPDAPEVHPAADKPTLEERLRRIEQRLDEIEAGVMIANLKELQALLDNARQTVAALEALKAAEEKRMREQTNLPPTGAAVGAKDKDKKSGQ